MLASSHHNLAVSDIFPKVISKDYPSLKNTFQLSVRAKVSNLSMHVNHLILSLSKYFSIFISVRNNKINDYKKCMCSSNLTNK